jgi:hypothetical protein
MEDRHHRNREMFLRLKAFAASHTDIPATTVWILGLAPQALCCRALRALYCQRIANSRTFQTREQRELELLPGAFSPCGYVPQARPDR